MTHNLKMNYKQAVSHWCVANLSPTQWQEVKEIGIEGVELAPVDKWDALKQIGFQIVSTGGHQSLGDGLNKPSNHARIADEIAGNLELARRYGVPNLIVFSGNRNGLSEEEGAQNTIAGLKMIAGEAEKAGVNLILELLNSKVDHKDYQCDRTTWGAEVVSAVGSPRVKLLFDIYHMQIMEGDLIRTIRDNIAHIAHFHTAGNPGRNDLDENQEIFYPAIARAIAQTGYDGWVGHEFKPKGEPVVALRQAFEQFDV